MYIDSSTGSMLIQALVAAIPVAAATLFAFRNKIRILFGKSPIEKRNKSAENAEMLLSTDDFEKIDD
ncbi:MAG: hypothetical protein LBL96_12345 [Clostridiales bacterium]|nr:hypothetical protein [Clostridiales bacterium]